MCVFLHYVSHCRQKRLVALPGFLLKSGMSKFHNAYHIRYMVNQTMSFSILVCLMYIPTALCSFLRFVGHSQIWVYSFHSIIVLWEGLCWLHRFQPVGKRGEKRSKVTKVLGCSDTAVLDVSHGSLTITPCISHPDISYDDGLLSYTDRQTTLKHVGDLRQKLRHWMRLSK